ncbi:hypothetical protein PAXRUDRAFT_827183 [Paxillus rubicundulus Ve08.2h10]|uniref:DUF4604 domain-containing protein n=1 Tax=Paxillus rubicundulus Ve08.2h10 TaxID=930991 RepID=A0A0D0DYG6_9AGAM|nr:hypothetical protein PAXRUDRAFT_827183 [Paxillus rubicundulus Ve08.2h10]
MGGSRKGRCELGVTPMAAKEPTRHQLSSRLQYQSHVPAFLQKFQNQVQGVANEDEDEPQYYDDGSGRPPIPVRPAIPERPSDDPGSADEDDDDEKPQVVVLRVGKHLTEREAENERRKEKGLPPLPITGESGDESLKQDSKKRSSKDVRTKFKQKVSSLSFSSSNAKSNTTSNKLKRRIVADGDDSGSESSKVKKAPKKKKSKREGKGLLSFGEDV